LIADCSRLLAEVEAHDSDKREQEEALRTEIRVMQENMDELNQNMIAQVQQLRNQLQSE